MSEENFDYYLELIKNTLTQRGTQYDDAFHKTWREWKRLGKNGNWMQLVCH